MTNAFVTSLLAFRKWKEGVCALGLTILMWYVITSIKWAGDPYALVRWYFPFLHLASFASLLIMRGKIGEWIEGLDPKKVPIGTFCLRWPVYWLSTWLETLYMWEYIQAQPGYMRLSFPSIGLRGYSEPLERRLSEPPCL